MNFPKTAATAQVESFEALNEGIWLTEESLNHIETALVNADATAAGLTETESQLDASNALLNAARESLEAANSTIAERDAEIARLTAELETERNRPAGEMATTSKEKDESGREKIPAHADPNSPINMLADKLMGRKAN